MDKSCRVSIICTAFNHENFIRDALDSFLAQKTDFPFEVIVTDDASTDSTPEILKQYAEQYPDQIRFFHQEKNLFSQGINVIDEVIVPNARGEYYAFCEGDDYWTDPEKLQLQVDFLDRHPDYTACVHNTTCHYCDSGTPDTLLIPPSGDHDIPFDVVVRNITHAFHTSSILVRAKYVAEPPDFQQVSFLHGGVTDYPMGIWFALNGNVRFLDRTMSVYRLKSCADSWSSLCKADYAHRLDFVIGEIEMFHALIPHLTPEQEAIARSVLTEREYELFYLQGETKKMLQAPYRKLFYAEPMSFKMKHFTKLLFPKLYEFYRKKRGYTL